VVRAHRSTGSHSYFSIDALRVLLVTLRDLMINPSGRACCQASCLTQIFKMIAPITQNDHYSSSMYLDHHM